VWIDHVAAWMAIVQTQRAYCAAQGLSYHAFDYWRRFVLRQDTSLTPHMLEAYMARDRGFRKSAAKGEPASRPKPASNH